MRGANALSAASPAALVGITTRVFVCELHISKAPEYNQKTKLNRQNVDMSTKMKILTRPKLLFIGLNFSHHVLGFYKTMVLPLEIKKIDKSHSLFKYLLGAIS
jgi:K+-transporting ATPase A subunit